MNGLTTTGVVLGVAGALLLGAAALAVVPTLGRPFLLTLLLGLVFLGLGIYRLSQA